ncbi:hypothetical protein NIES3275_15860 [Microchaete diplosiphon NIES-3275]|nr:hypothetical protein NIES3275_15860 [Microchaete diplosiphon NIES-3275]
MSSYRILDFIPMIWIGTGGLYLSKEIVNYIT